jgi:nucleotide-binding universal stress UspA family protein
LSAADRLLALWDIEAETLRGEGHSAKEILRVAGERAADLIVVGARGISGLRGLVLGSVTQRVVRHGGTSVLIARTRPENLV